jgi:acetyltransferase-like isoleucine patch superfamily enzyme
MSEKYTSGENFIIGQNVYIGKDCHFGHNVVIRDDTRIGDNAFVEDGVVLGRVPRQGKFSKRRSGEVGRCYIGDNAVIGTNAIIYAGTQLGNDVMVGDLASIRENVTIGSNVIIGRLVMVEPHTKIGNNVKIQTGTHITGDAVVEDNVFFGDEVSTTNDNKMGRGDESDHKGFTAKKGCRIGSNSTLLPGVVIGEDAVVAAGAIVTRDVENGTTVMGKAAKPYVNINLNDFQG